MPRRRYQSNNKWIVSCCFHTFFLTELAESGVEKSSLRIRTKQYLGPISSCIADDAKIDIVKGYINLHKSYCLWDCCLSKRWNDLYTREGRESMRLVRYHYFVGCFVVMGSCGPIIAEAWPSFASVSSSYRSTIRLVVFKYRAYVSRKSKKRWIGVYSQMLDGFVKLRLKNLGVLFQTFSR